MKIACVVKLKKTSPANVGGDGWMTADEFTSAQAAKKGVQQANARATTRVEICAIPARYK